MKCTDAFGMMTKLISSVEDVWDESERKCLCLSQVCKALSIYRWYGSHESVSDSAHWSIVTIRK